MLSSFFPWHLAEVTWGNKDDQTHYQNSQLTHYFHDGFRPRSDHIELLGPLFEKINFKGLNRIKANLLMRTDKKKVSIGIFGKGFVGTAVAHGFSHQTGYGADIRIYDIV